MNVKIYSTPTCPWCHKAKDYMKEHKVKFEDLDISQNEKARNEMIEKSGQMGVPVIDINGHVVIGFNEPRIKELLKK